jgi:hypothetical protein
MLVPFSPKPGLNSDDTTFAAEGRWADGNNVRFVGGRAQVIEGWVSLFALSDSTYGTVKNIFPFTRAGDIVIAYGTRAAITGPRLLVGSGLSAPADRTPAGLDSGIRHWSLDAWGDTLLAVPKGGTLYEQSGSGTATEVTEAPDQICTMLVARRFVLAFGCNEEASGDFNSRCIRWCDFEDYTNWTSTPDNNAGEYVIDGAGAIVGAHPIGDHIAVWTESALYLGTYEGAFDLTWRFDKVDDNCGLAGPMAKVVHGGIAYWMGRDLSIRRWAVGGLPEIVPCPISRDFETNADLGKTDLIAAVAMVRHDEIWFHYADSRGGDVGILDNNRFIAFSVRDGAWFRGQSGRSAMVDTGLISSLTSAYPRQPTVLAATPGWINLHGPGYSGTGSSPLRPFIQSADQYLDNSQRRMMIRGMIPDVEDLTLEDPSYKLAVTLTLRDRPMSTPVTKGPYGVTATDTKKDFRASGKIVSVKWSLVDGTGEEAGNGYFRLGKPLFDVVPLGER